MRTSGPNGYPLFIYSNSYDEHVRKKLGKLRLDRNYKIHEIFMGHDKR